MNGEVVARKGDATPWDHVTEVREAQNGLSNQINRLKRQLSDSRLSPEDRPASRPSCPRPVSCSTTVSSGYHADSSLT
ncbi:polymorphic toxin type 28 domain-containing protein [Amycolatopsis sp. NPDC098790]|uniref:polymorphic toxin type 28 domain-containing protein n=1 Tax=Amycolatopsis sp. NPDC098790 TaxID=3363939 RepID=UPI00381866B7